MFFSSFIPLIIFSINSLRKKISFIYFAALSGVFGMVFNRLNVGGLTHLNNLSDLGTFYFPAWTEIAISAGVVSAAMLVFFFFVENFNVCEKQPENKESTAFIKTKFNSFKVYLGESKIRNRSKFTFAFVLAFAFAFAIISSDKIYSDGFERIEVKKARGRDTLLIDGNRDGYGVRFAHKFHSDSIKIECYTCHHLNKPLDKNTECYECHNEMYIESDVFKHDWHSSKKGANLDCF